MTSLIDHSVLLLIHRLPTLTGKVLIVADENWARVDWSTFKAIKHCSINVISNRFDVAESARAEGVNCQFNDFDLTETESHSFDYVLYRVSKERSTTHHVINAACRVLKRHGKLLITGAKNNGFKSYLKRAGNLFGEAAYAKKNGEHYLASVTLHDADRNWLNDKSYQRVRPTEALDGQYHSKPGIFGWDQIDQGSAFLVTHLEEFLGAYEQSPHSLLDLGCGYGFLACEARQFNFQHITGTDNNAAALIACRANFARHLRTPNNVIVADAGAGIEQRFDTILCNPPFHRGFKADPQLGTKFLSATQRLLTPSGRALFVVNQFISLEREANHYFNTAEVLASNRSYKLIVLRQ